MNTEKELKKEKKVDKKNKKIPTIEEAIKRIELKQQKEVKKNNKKENKQVNKEEKDEEIVIKDLSLPAQKWRDYLKLQGTSPEQFLKKYTPNNHRYYYLVKEVFDYEKNLKKISEKISL